jgi:hypothetical protein
MNRTEYLVPSESSDVTLAPQDDKAKTHSEDNATPMPLTVTRLTRWKRIDAFERDTAGAANQSVLKVTLLQRPLKKLKILLRKSML